MPPNEPEQFDLLDMKNIPVREVREKNRQFESAIWTHRKALLIQTYLDLFSIVTYRGTYIDCFAGPQDGRRDSDTWAARKIWESNPGKNKRRITRLELFELDPTSHRHLEEMIKGTDSDGRKIYCERGDCNVILPRRLSEFPVTGPAFCLLDQRSDECHWNTVRAVANHKSDPEDPYKIEIFYFLMASWYDRYKAGLGNSTREARLRRWWGEEDFPLLDKACPIRASEMFSDRFRNEFGYKHVHPYPIFDNISPSENGVVKFYMIHASDHDEAPKFMRRAYRRLGTGWDPTKVQEPMPFLKDSLEGTLSSLEKWDRYLTDEEKFARRKRRTPRRK